MKRLIIGVIALGSFLIPKQVHAVVGVFKSSNTATAESAGLCGGGSKAYIRGVCVNTTATTSSVTLYNSSFTTTGVTRVIGAIDTNQVGCKNYDTVFPAGLYYSKSGTANITMLFDCL